MNTFIKTFFICFIVVLAFIAYNFLNSDSYDKNLKISSQNEIFGLHSEKNEQQTPIEEQKYKNEQTQIQEKNVEKNAKQYYIHTCYFYAPSGKLEAVKRELPAKPTIENVITLLLKGPLVAETKKGLYSEIPPKVDLISVKKENDSIYVNLTSNFGSGGGSQSIENRVKQLSKTVKNIAPDKKIYLYIDNKEVEYLGGDGVYIKQPLE